MISLARNVAYILAALAILAACSQDPLHLSYREVAGKFVLHRWEDGKTYYLEDSTRESANGGGVLDGVVTEIGWTTSYIVARRHAIYGGDPDGWMIIDVAKGSVRGPYRDKQIAELPEVRGIHTYSAEQAWETLR
jgi:hypothetical protein